MDKPDIGLIPRHLFTGTDEERITVIRDAIKHRSRQGLKPDKEWLKELHDLGAEILKWKESDRWPQCEEAWVNDSITLNRAIDTKRHVNIFINGEDYLCTVADEWRALEVADTLRSYCGYPVMDHIQGLIKAGAYMLSITYDVETDTYWIDRYRHDTSYEFNPGHPCGILPL